MTAQREAFEAAFPSVDPGKWSDKEYRHSEAWQVWQVAQAAMPQRVPMTEEQVASFLDAWATSSRSMKLIGLIRAIESHYSIGAKP